MTTLSAHVYDPERVVIMPFSKYQAYIPRWYADHAEANAIARLLNGRPMPIGHNDKYRFILIDLEGLSMSEAYKAKDTLQSRLNAYREQQALGECSCYLPDQNCGICRAAARQVYADEFGFGELQDDRVATEFGS